MPITFNDGNAYHYIGDVEAYLRAGRTVYEMRTCSASLAADGATRIPYVDSKFQHQRDLVQPRVKAYLHYQFPWETAGTPEAQAEFFCKALGSLRPNEMVMLDIEGASQITNPVFFVQRWCAVVESRLQTLAWIYIPKSLSDDLPPSVTGSRIVKAPDYDANDGQPHTPPTWPHDVWQYSSKGFFPGSPHGPGDVNVTDLTAEDMLRRCFPWRYRDEDDSGAYALRLPATGGAA